MAVCEDVNAMVGKVVEWTTFVVLFSAIFVIKWMAIFFMAVVITALTLKD
jgi:general stress protein CsbA